VQWTHDESLVFHLVTNEVHIYNAHTFQRVGKVRCPNIASFSLPSVKGYSANTTMNSTDAMNERKYLLTTFVSGSKGKPSRVDLLRYPDRLGVESSTIPSSTTSIEKEEEDGAVIKSGPGLASKSLFDAEEVHVNWSPRADSALVLTQTVVDATGESYYGSSHLFLLLENDIKRPGYGIATSVTLPTEATKSVHGSIPILCANWVPNPTISGPVPFGVISGSMPPLASLHHGITAEPTFLFGRAHRNTMDISPHGRFIVCGGYGNLAGGMDFWDRNKGKLIPRRMMVPPPSTNAVTSPEATMSYVTPPKIPRLVINGVPIAGPTLLARQVHV
jgi:translation initiation factor 2A